MQEEKSKVEVRVDGKQAGTELAELREKARQLNKEYVKLHKQKLGNSTEAKKLKKDFTAIEKEIIKLTKKTDDYSKTLKDLSGSSIRDLTKLHKHLNFEVKQYGRNSKEYKTAANSLKLVKAEMAKVRTEMNAAIPKTNRFGQSLKSIGANLAGALGITGGITMLVGALQSFIQKAKIVNELNKKIIHTFDLQGKAARNATSSVLALAETFDTDYNEILKATNTVSKEMRISVSESLKLIEQGFKKGSDNSGEFMDILKEYPTQFREAGIDAETMFAIINQQVKEGIYSDKGIDAIKEGGLRLRENNKATQEALKVLDESTQAQIKQEIAAGNSFKAIQLVSQALKNSSLTANETQTIIADVFGGPGEDAGLRYLKMLSDIDTNLENVASQTSIYQDATLKLSKQYNKFTLSATEGNGVFSKSLTGVADTASDVLTSLIKINDGNWSDKLKAVANGLLATSFLTRNMKFEYEETAKELTRLTNQKFTLRVPVGSTPEEKAALKAKQDAAKKASAEMLKDNAQLADMIKQMNVELVDDERQKAEQELAIWFDKEQKKINISKAATKQKNVALEVLKRLHEKKLADIEETYSDKREKAFAKIYDFIEEKEADLNKMSGINKKVADIDKFYDDLIASIEDFSGSEDEINNLNLFRKQEINKLKTEDAEQTEQRIFDIKKQYGLLTDEEVMTAEIEAVKALGEERILNEEEVQAAIEEIRNKYAKKQETAKEKKAREDKELEDKEAAIIEAFVGRSTEIMGNALVQSNDMAKQAMKDFLLLSLDMLKRYVQLMIVTATAKEIGTKGAIGVITGAILGGLIEAAYGTAKGVVDGFSEGGYTGQGQKQEVAGVVHKDEYVVPSSMLANNDVRKVVGVLETARTGGGLDYSALNTAISKGFAEGGYTGAQTEPSMMDAQAAGRLSNAIDNLVDRGVPAYVKDNTIADMRKRFAVHEEIERSASL